MYVLASCLSCDKSRLSAEKNAHKTPPTQNAVYETL